MIVVKCLFSDEGGCRYGLMWLLSSVCLAMMVSVCLAMRVGVGME